MKKLSNDSVLDPIVLKQLSDLIAIPSKYDKTTVTKDAPFGHNCKLALDYALSIGVQYGLNTSNKASYGYIEYGQGKQCVAALTHLDVVSEGDVNQWSSLPYQLTIRDGVMYGRGISDDKGMAIACLQALIRLKNNNIKLKRRVRLILGTNEETASMCMHDYVKNCKNNLEDMPAYSFTPDSDFPLTNSEKGILNFNLTLLGDCFNHCFIDITGGEARNIVPEKCTATIKHASGLYDIILKKYPNIPYTPSIKNGSTCTISLDSSKNIILSVQGKPEHAMNPNLGINAIIGLFSFLGSLADKKNTHPLLNQFATMASIFDNHNLAALELNIDDVDSGELTLNLGLIKLTKQGLVLTFDARLPIVINDMQTQNKFMQGLTKYNIKAKYQQLIFKPNLYIDEHTPLVQALLSVYTKHTGLKGRCLKSGGGTYARELPNAIAFGARFEGTQTNLHKANECYSIKDFNKLVDICYDAFIAISELD